MGKKDSKPEDKGDSVEQNSKQNATDTSDSKTKLKSEDSNEVSEKEQPNVQADSSDSPDSKSEANSEVSDGQNKKPDNVKVEENNLNSNETTVANDATNETAGVTENNSWSRKINYRGQKIPVVDWTF